MNEVALRSQAARLKRMLIVFPPVCRLHRTKQSKFNHISEKMLDEPDALVVHCIFPFLFHFESTIIHSHKYYILELYKGLFHTSVSFRFGIIVRFIAM